MLTRAMCLSPRQDHIIETDLHLELATLLSTQLLLMDLGKAVEDDPRSQGPAIHVEVLNGVLGT